jgi:hypothetical protein
MQLPKNTPTRCIRALSDERSLHVTTPEVLNTVLAIMGGVALAASCGFRVFIPMLVLSIAGKSGAVTLASGFDWISSTPALVTFSVASALEIGAFYIPWLDHALDTIAAPSSVVAGSLAVTSQITSMDPWLSWTVGILAGGGAAAVVQAASMLTRGASLALTGGLGNPVVATVENGAAIGVSVLAVVIPIVAIILIGLIVIFAVWLVTKRRARVRANTLPTAPLSTVTHVSQPA